ncbi:MAG: choice-of-anchor D domain-containing protein, partial [Betaproteobacteria bacterium]|nr:choice-of-anchor D domain-containing protein [Betaproteobacteria bacterium]
TSSATLTVTATSPAITLTASAVNFGTRTINTTSPVTTVTLTNTGMANLLISAITGTGGDFAFTTTCPISTPPVFVAGTCTFNITFTPLTAAALTGSITIASNAPGSPHVISLSGTGTAVAVPNIALSASLIDFGSQPLGTTSEEILLAVTNPGFATLSLSGIAVTGADFQRAIPASAPASNCGTSLAPGGLCFIALRFTPSALGSVSGQVNITSNAAGSPHVVSLAGIGTALAQPGITLPSSVNFGNQAINTTSSGLALSILNDGNAVLAISSVVISGANASEFRTAGDCSSVAPLATCTLTLTFAPGAVGARTALLTITSNAHGSSSSVSTVALTGTGILPAAPIVSLSLTAIGYGNNIFGGATPNQSVTLRNTGGAALAVSSIFTIGDFVQSNNCPSSLAPGASCVVNVLFSPLGMGGRSGELQVLSNAVGSPHKVQLSGTGCRWFSQAQSRLFLTLCGN